MASEYVLWFDARCSASKRALALLRERGVEPELRRHLEEPPTEEELWALLHHLGCSAHAVLRTDEDEYQALRLSPRTPEPELVAAIVAHPRILERPIFVARAARPGSPDGGSAEGGAATRAVVGRPPERVLDLL